jgi:hypothetical protein
MELEPELFLKEPGACQTSAFVYLIKLLGSPITHLVDFDYVFKLNLEESVAWFPSMRHITKQHTVTQKY